MSTAAPTPPARPAAAPGRRRTGLWIGLGLAAVGFVVFVLVWFQPQKLFIDDTVDEALPVVDQPPAAPGGEAGSGTGRDSGPADDPTASSAPAPEATSAAPAPTTAPPPAFTTLVSGSFVSLDHATSGQAAVLELADGARYLRFEGFETDNGPDLFVYLSTSPPDGEEAAFDDDVVNLGRLKGNIGDQNFEVPAGVELGRFASVVIWCDRFDSAFGAAPLG